MSSGRVPTAIGVPVTCAGVALDARDGAVAGVGDPHELVGHRQGLGRPADRDPLHLPPSSIRGDGVVARQRRPRRCRRRHERVVGLAADRDRLAQLCGVGVDAEQRPAVALATQTRRPASTVMPSGPRPARIVGATVGCGGGRGRARWPWRCRTSVARHERRHGVDLGGRQPARTPASSLAAGDGRLDALGARLGGRRGSARRAGRARRRERVAAAAGGREDRLADGRRGRGSALAGRAVSFSAPISAARRTAAGPRRPRPPRSAAPGCGRSSPARLRRGEAVVRR